ncbi:hypothetical protein Lal_00022442 [Lupinus albus]|nr:hypothetical protein Lal_00022442 [Lupinus albus]
MMLTVVKGPTCYEDIRTISNVQYPTFRDACFAIGLVLTDEQLQNLTLLEIEKLLELNRRSLKDYPSMPYPNGHITSQLGNKLIYEELNHDTNELKKIITLMLTYYAEEQCNIFHTIMEVVNHQQGHMFFLYGYGGTGKTNMWITLTFALRSQKHIVLTVDSNGIAYLLLPGGRKVHSKFKIHVPTFDNAVCIIH